MTKMPFEWIDFYTELADRLLEYKNNRTELVGKIVQIYERAEMKLPTLEADRRLPDDIDPFTVFGLFNKGITEKNRLKLMREFRKPLMFRLRPRLSLLACRY